ncbi:hypothetical protein [Mesorhizobium sp. BR1-1-14]|uniref:hypothetical protein n=1 Tax=Mesorhizobium sp. BR1-1-14 TaxID=2876655 RepID=UPI001CD0AC8A|nr:hypothetical protein [Mesorhizobium sp. BR1-1-14]MBZ9959326.1 hypothetical protein [Mesorhizobium sp. BR1-1-14]
MGAWDKKAVIWLTRLGVLALLFCVVSAALLGAPGHDVNDKTCREALVASLEDTIVPEAASDEVRSKAEAKAALDAAGRLRIAGVAPATTEFGRHLCAVVAGATTEAKETEAANAVMALEAGLAAGQNKLNAETEASRQAAEQQVRKLTSDLIAARIKAAEEPAPVELAVFFDGERAPFKVAVKAMHGPQLLRFRLAALDDAKAEGAQFWRQLVRGVGWAPSEWGRKPVTLGLSRAETATMVPDAISTEPFELYVYSLPPVLAGVAALILLAAAFCLYARGTTLLRDNAMTAGAYRADLAEKLSIALEDQKDAKKETAEVQTELDKKPEDETLRSAKEAAEKTIAAAEDAVKKIKAQQTTWNDVPDEAPAGPFSLGRTQMAFWLFLVVAGYLFVALSIGQYLGLITGEVLVLLGISGVTGLAAVQITGDKATGRASRGFIQDILSTEGGPQMQRLQAVAWTVILGGIFVWIAVRDYRFPTFDVNLLLLMGIAQSLYIGFKLQEGNK